MDPIDYYNKYAAKVFEDTVDQNMDAITAPFLELLEEGDTILDMGCGTAILAILAAKMGAAHTYGIDIDAVAAVSAFDNARINKVSRHVETYCGDASLLQAGKYDVLLANINRNILIQDIPTYARSLRKGGMLLPLFFFPC